LAAWPTVLSPVSTSNYHQDEHIFPALRAGAISYILKDVKMDQLAEAIRQAVRGEATLHPRVATRLIQELHGPKQGNINPFTELTDREMGVLKLIADGLTNNQISERLVISENTVKGHVSNILSKLHLADRTQAAVYAWKEGIVRRDRDASPLLIPMFFFVALVEKPHGVLATGLSLFSHWPS